MTTATATLHELQNDFPAVEKAAGRGSVRITRKGRVIGIYTAIKSAGRKGWKSPNFLGRGAITNEPIDVRDYLG